MIKKFFWHVIAWCILFSYSYIELLVEGDWNFQLAMLVLSLLFTNFAAFYSFYFIVWKPLFSQNKDYRFLLLIPVGLVFFIGFRFLIEEVLYDLLFGFDNYYNVSLLFYFRDNFWRAVLVGLASLVTVLYEYKNQNEKKILQLNNEKNDAELSLLRSQLNPHFLFNTLSFLHVKTRKYDLELGDTVQKLSEMLRYSLESSKETQVPIGKEIKLLGNYIDIFRKRFEGNFFVDFNVNGVEIPVNIEPMLLIPFVENSFKHGVVNNPDTPVQISIAIKRDSILFHCRNQVGNFEKDHTSGIGLENIKQRLILLYRDKHELIINDDNSCFEVSLRLDIG